MEDNPSKLSHSSVGTNDLASVLQSYDTVPPAIGCRRRSEHPGAVAYARAYPEFRVQTPADGRAASIGNGNHVRFFPEWRQAADDFHRQALGAGCVDAGAPGAKPEHGATHHECFVRDPDCHETEATLWDVSLQQGD